MEPQLDCRFAAVSFEGTKTFDGWLTLGSLAKRGSAYAGMKLMLPFKRHKHMNELCKRGALIQTAKLGVNHIQLTFEIPEPVSNVAGGRLGVDIGIKTLFSTSDGFQTKPDIHGHTYETVMTKMCMQRKGSSGYRKSQKLRDRLLNAAVKRIDLSKVSTLVREDLRKMVGASRLTSKFNHSRIAMVLDEHAAKHGVRVVRVAPSFTSQRCSCCGWVHKSNRNGETFCCGSCGHAANADINASINIGLVLPPVRVDARSLGLGRTGFFWSNGEAHIVPPYQKQPS